MILPELQTEHLYLSYKYKSDGLLYGIRVYKFNVGFEKVNSYVLSTSIVSQSPTQQTAKPGKDKPFDQP